MNFFKSFFLCDKSPADYRTLTLSPCIYITTTPIRSIPPLPYTTLCVPGVPQVDALCALLAVVEVLLGEHVELAVQPARLVPQQLSLAL